MIHFIDESGFLSGSSAQDLPVHFFPNCQRVESSEPLDDGNYRYVDGTFVRLEDDGSESVSVAERALVDKKSKVREEAEATYKQPVEVEGVLWNGGEKSASSILNAIELATYFTKTSLVLTDVTNKEHTKSIQDARNVAAHIGMDYQTKFLHKQARMRALDAVDLTASDALSQIEAI